MKGGSLAVFRRLGVSGLRGFCAVYLLLFFGSVAAATHRHTNDFEDLLTDGPSDSGVFFTSSRPFDPSAGVEWTSATLVDDDPCLACFHNDWATETIALLDIVPTFHPISAAPLTHEPDPAPSPARSGSSRAPPAAS